MPRRKLLYLRPRNVVVGGLHELHDDWEIITPEPNGAGPADCRLGLLGIDSEVDLPRLQQLVADAEHVRWVALVERAAFDSEWLREFIQRFCWDYHTLPLDLPRLRAVLGHLYGMAALEGAAAQSVRPLGEMVGNGRAMQRLYRIVRKMAKVDAPVLVQGESGTGKELVARAIHRASPRAHGPFIAVNCGALPPSLIQSELFGHERGAFTGAAQRKLGRIEAAHGGTIFLDEIGDLALDLQVNLLRFLQEQTIERLGGASVIPVDVRVIAATHVDLELAVAEKRFREDLYYRLNVLRVEMPPLRQRLEDVPALAMHFFSRFSGEKAPNVRGFSQEAFDAMLRHAWPGNVRELLNRVRRAMVMCEGRLIGAADLGLERPSESFPSLASTRADAERSAVQSALLAAANNISRTAELLGVSRVTLYRLMEKYGLQAGSLAGSDAATRRARAAVSA